MELKLRDYQKEALEKINKQESGSYLIVMATGLGKTVVFSQIKRKGRVLLLSHREELVYQPQKYYDCSFGVEKAEVHSNGEEVVSASVQSLVRRLEDFQPDDFDMIITDEAHHAVAPSYRQIYDYFRPRLHIGFTATPNRADNVKLGEIYSKVLFERNLKWGIQNHYLSDIRCFQVDIGYDISKVKKQADDLNLQDLEKAMNIENQNKAIAEAYAKYAVGQTLIFATSVRHAENIAAEIPGAVVVTAKTENRDAIIKDFTERKIPCLVNCMVFTEGTDMPLIETIIIARPTRNASLYTQMVGRGLRMYEGKKELVLLDCVGVTGKLNICAATSLFGLEGEIVDKVMSEANSEEGILLTEVENQVQEIEEEIRTDWKLNLHRVELFQENYDTYHVNYVIHADGHLSCNYQFGKSAQIIVTAPDLAGNSDILLLENHKPIRKYASVPTQTALHSVYSFLQKNFRDSQNLWDYNRVMRWGAEAATEKQKAALQKILPKEKQKDIAWDKLTKYDANVLFSTLQDGKK